MKIEYRTIEMAANQMPAAALIGNNFRITSDDGQVFYLTDAGSHTNYGVPGLCLRTDDGLTVHPVAFNTLVLTSDFIPAGE